MNKHDHISGRPRDYISRKRFYRGRHRGVYKPNFHWPHIACYETYCHVSTEWVTLHPYVDVVGGGEIDGCTTITFTPTEREGSVQAV
jgi:hypothetical protein